MKKALPHGILVACVVLVLGIAIGCQDQLVEPSASDVGALAPQAADSDQGSLLSKKGPPSTATVKFGRNDIGSPFPPPEEHDMSTHAKDALQPRTVVISVGGQVTFNVGAFHKIAIYDDGTQPEDINVASTEPSGMPFPFPPIINDPANRIARGALVFPGPVADFSWTFNEPGRYLVICEVLPHFADNDMYGWVIVK